MFEENRRLRNETFARILADWSDPDQAALAAMLARLTSSIEAVGGHLGPAPAVPAGGLLSAPRQHP